MIDPPKKLSEHEETFMNRLALIIGIVLMEILGVGRPVPYAGAEDIQTLMEKAKHGDPQAEARLGWLYINGQGVEKDYAQAAFWIRKAAEEGNTTAQAGLGWLYANGLGIEKNYAQAASWYKKAAKQGLSIAQANLGTLYAQGHGVPKDYSKAAFWFRKAANKGSFPAQKNLARVKRLILSNHSDFPPPDNNAPSASGISQDEAQSIAEQAAEKAASKTNQEIADLKKELTKTTVPQAMPSPTYDTSVDTPTYHASRHSKDFALVIGVEKYPSPIHQATFADRDAQTMFAHLRALGVPVRHIKRLSDETATRGRIKGAIHWLKRNVQPGSTVYVYFSGHGAPGPRGHAYLVPFDGDPSDLSDTGFSTATFYRDLERLPAKHVIVALDACFTGNGGRSVLGKGLRPLRTVIKGHFPQTGKVIAFSAAQSNQEAGPMESEGHGLFTYYFLKGLDGEAERQGRVTVGSLSRYLKAKVPEAANLDNRDQVPQVEPSPVGPIAEVRIR